MTILKTKQGAWRTVSLGEISRHSMDSAKWMAAQLWMSDPLWKGSVLDALILMCILKGGDGASTGISWTVRWIKGKKLAKLGTVNSAAQRKPKYPRVHATQNMQ